MRCALVERRRGADSGQKDSAWGWIEGEGGGDVASFRGVLDGGADDGLMAEVDTVEIANGEDAAAAGGGVLSRPLIGRGESSDGVLRGSDGNGDGTAGKRGRGRPRAHRKLKRGRAWFTHIAHDFAPR